MSIIRKSPYDKREYKVITLNNGLRAILCSTRNHLLDIAKQNKNNISEEILEILNADSNTTISYGSEEEMISKSLEKLVGVSMCVGTGSFSDPPDLMGLAHLSEHLAFMGTKKYPGDNTFDGYLSEHEGDSNANTSPERTVFHYEINKKFFIESLELFSEFFTDLSMDSSTIEKEIEVVDSEFQLNESLWEICRDLLLATSAPEGHPLRNFLWGNRESLSNLPKKLKIDVRQKLKDFVSEHYCASNMTLAIISPEDMFYLEKAVHYFFSKLPLNLPPQKKKDILEPFNRPQFRRLYKMVSISKSNLLYLTWSLPSLMYAFKTLPLQIFGTLVEQEGHGSIIEQLRHRSWAIEISAENNDGGFEHNIYHSLFTIQIVLTEDGMENIKEVIFLCLQYLELMRQNLYCFENIFNDLKNINYAKFFWKDKDVPSIFASELAENLMIYGEEYCLVGGNLFLEYDEKVIKECLDRLKPELMNIIIVSSRFKNYCKQEEPWTSAVYSVEDIPKSWLREWNNIPIPETMHLPSPNMFISTNFEIKNPDYSTSPYPALIYDNNKTKIWYKKDLNFKVPKAYILLHLISPICKKFLQNAILTDFYAILLEQVLKEKCFPATAAGLEIEVNSKNTGIVVWIYGFNDKLLMLFKDFIDIFCNSEITDHVLFNNIKQKLGESYCNTVLDSFVLSQDLELSILEYCHWSYLDRNNCLQDITIEMLLDFSKSFRSNIFVEGLIQGNINFDEAKRINSKLINCLKPKAFLPKEFPKPIGLQYPIGDNILRVAPLNKCEVNSVVCNLYQIGPETLFDRCCLDLFTSIMKDPLYDTLRTEDHLGYEIDGDFTSLRNILSFYIYVTGPSSKHTCDHINHKMKMFLKSHIEEMSALDEDNFHSCIRSHIKNKGEPDTDIDQEIGRNFEEIVLSRYDFDRNEQEIKFFNNLKFSDFKLWIAKYFVPLNCPHLSIQIVGSEELDSANTSESSFSKSNLSVKIGDSKQSIISVLTNKTHKMLEQHVSSLSSSPDGHDVRGVALKQSKISPLQHLQHSSPSEGSYNIKNTDSEQSETLNLTYIIPEKSYENEFISDIDIFRRNLTAFKSSTLKHNSIF